MNSWSIYGKPIPVVDMEFFDAEERWWLDAAIKYVPAERVREFERERMLHVRETCSALNAAVHLLKPES